MEFYADFSMLSVFLNVCIFYTLANRPNGIAGTLRTLLKFSVIGQRSGSQDQMFTNAT